MLELTNVEVKYNDVILVLRGISLNVPEGDIICLLGANGAGKSTTLKAVSGLLSSELGKVTDGRIVWKGKRIENGDPEMTARMGIIQVQEGRQIFEHLTVEENLILGANFRKDGENIKGDLEMIYDYFPRLKLLRKRISGFLSGGEQQMMIIGRAMMGSSDLMMLDEPSLGLAPLVVAQIFNIIGRYNLERRVSMLLVEQNARAALSLAKYGYVMENGRIVLDGNAEKLRDNEDIKEFYLGLTQIGERKSYRDVKHYKRRKRWLG